MLQLRHLPPRRARLDVPAAAFNYDIQIRVRPLPVVREMQLYLNI